MYTAVGSGVVLGLVYVSTADGTRSTGRAAVAIAAYAAGSALGTFAAGVRTPGRWWRGIAGGFLVLAVGAALISASQPFLVIGGALLVGLGEGFALVLYLAIRSDGVRDELLSRVDGGGGVLGNLAATVGVAWMGIALQVVHGMGAFLLVAVLVLGLASWAGLGDRHLPLPNVH